MEFRIKPVSEVIDKPALDELMLEFYSVVLAKLAAVGGPRVYSPEDLTASFWRNLQKCLPPTGRLMLVQNQEGRLVGCGTLQQSRPDAGELKRLYVRPEANGHGLGRALVDARMGAAREMGWKRVLVNAIRENQDMLRIYEKIGFRYIDRYPECSDPVELSDYFIYMQYDFA